MSSNAIINYYLSNKEEINQTATSRQSSLLSSLAGSMPSTRALNATRSLKSKKQLKLLWEEREHIEHYAI